MKFLKINAKVLLILCLFSGILFLSTGCGDNTEDKDNVVAVAQHQIILLIIAQMIKK